jgi:hypothetical protein
VYNGFLWAITQKLAGSVPSPSVGVLPCYSSVCPRNVPFSHPPSVRLDNFTRTARSSLLEVFQSGVDVVSATLGPKNISNFGPRRAPPSGSGSAEEREQTAPVAGEIFSPARTTVAGRSSASLPLRALPA